MSVIIAGIEYVKVNKDKLNYGLNSNIVRWTFDGNRFLCSRDECVFDALRAWYFEECKVLTESKEDLTEHIKHTLKASINGARLDQRFKCVLQFLE